MNKITAMFDLEHIKSEIAECPNDEIIILCPHWSINKPKYEGEDPEAADWDLEDFEELLGVPVMVNQYDDLIADPHFIMD